ncbi:cytochrome b6f subunit family protein [uncultured Prochlorococcus sp.]|uniref:cytochrome b6-f complex subunit PetP n=1 Tax=uncultured Prochlorococcus sp. TaxID=159733 RepID=UPI002589DA95|nr:cytochrome b6f subunit family protein [uncultured Prochlorococcus sp.]
MSILDKAKIGNYVQVNLELSRDRLTKETIDAINVSSLGKISDFRITDGKGIGVVLQLSNEKEQWFFEDEIDLLDENGNVIKKYNDKKKNSNFIFKFLKGLNYEHKNQVSELLNPINFFIWLVVSFKDIF